MNINCIGVLDIKRDVRETAVERIAGGLIEMVNI
jgi:hypothetical protein